MISTFAQNVQRIETNVLYKKIVRRVGHLPEVISICTFSKYKIFITNILVQHISPICKGHAVEEECQKHVCLNV